MKKILLSLLFLTALCAGAYAEKADPLQYRRTLFVPIAQKMMVFEAPVGHCFLDRTIPAEEVLFQSFAAAAKKEGKMQLAIFAPCRDVANLGYDITGLMSIGGISWLHPLVGEKVSSRGEYLAHMQGVFEKRVEKEAVGKYRAYQMEEAAHHTAQALSIGLSADIKTESATYKVADMIATTSIRNLPLEIILRKGGEEQPDIAALMPLIDTMVAQQIALNE